jgi:hypothetical protein
MKAALDHTRWFQRELARIDRRIMKPETTAERKQELWAERNRLFNEPGYAEGLYQDWRRQR